MAQTFDFETMAVVLYAMMESGVSLGAKHYQMMSAIDGTRGPDGFNHQFRKVKARAKELQDQAKSGNGVLTPVKKTKTPTKKAKGEDGEKKSTPKRGRSKKAEAADDEEDGDESPSKKVKTEEDGEEDSEELV